MKRSSLSWWAVFFISLDSFDDSAADDMADVAVGSIARTRTAYCIAVHRPTSVYILSTAAAPRGEAPLCYGETRCEQ